MASRVSWGRSPMIQHLITSFSYGGLLLVLLLGSIGLPIPEEVPIVTAGVLSHYGVMRWWLALPTVIVGVFTGDIFLYWVGRRYGVGVLDHPLIGRLVDRGRLERVEVAYRRRGALIVFLARHIIGVRAAAFVGAGIVRLPFWKFLLADGAAISYGIPLNFFLAFLFTRHLHAIMAEVHRVEHWIAVLAVAAAGIGLYVGLRWRSGRALAGAAEGAR